MKFQFAGAATFALGLLVLGAVSVASGEFIPTLQPVPVAFEMAGKAALLNGILIAVLAAGIFLVRFRGPAAALLAAYLSTWLFVAQLPQLFFGVFKVIHLLGLLQLAAIIAALILLAFGTDARSGAPAKVGRAMYGCMALAFVLVNFQDHEIIASLIPEWMPFAAIWLWFTASANLAVAVSFLTGIKVQLGGALIGATYASWIPIVHLPRLIETPADVGEWAAGALAITLAGAALLISGWRGETAVGRQRLPQNEDVRGGGLKIGPDPQ